MSRATINWKRCQFVNIWTHFLLKKSLILPISLLRKSRAWGWSCSTDWDTSMTYILSSQYSILYSLRSAWINLHSWYRILMILTTYRYSSLHLSIYFMFASFSLGAFSMSLPMKSITSTFDFTNKPTGLSMTPSILFKFLNYFSAHILTIFLGLLEQYPLLNLNSPSTYLSLSLKTKMDVLYIFIAYYLPVVLLTAW